MDFRVLIVRAAVIPGSGGEGTHHVYTASDGKEYKSHRGINGIKMLMQKDGYLFFHRRDEKYVH